MHCAERYRIQLAILPGQDMAALLGEELRDSLEPDSADYLKEKQLVVAATHTLSLKDINKDKDKDAPPAPAPGSDVPDGGLLAWMQVVGAWILFFNTWYA